jgi:hypothetical protein
VIQEGREQPEEADNGNNHAGLYTSTTSGQNTYGGWTEEGLLRFNHYVAMNQEAREGPNCEQVEKNCLRMLRAKYNITCNNFSDQNRLNLRHKRARKVGKNVDVVPPPMQRVVRTVRQVLEESSDEDEDED